MADRPHGAVAPAAWDEYWRLSHEAAAHPTGGPQEEVLARFWTSFLRTALANVADPRLIDLACGNGAMLRFALDSARRAGRPLLALGVDNSPAAIADLKRRLPAVLGLVADVRQAPFPDGGFDIVGSQFGLEYGGLAAFDEAARLVAPGGMLALIVHLKDGAIYRECAANLQAIDGVRRCGILAATRDVFRAAAEGMRRAGDAAAAKTRLLTAAREMEEILRTYGSAVAGGIVQRLYVDMGHMCLRVNAFRPTEVLHWVANMERESEAYAKRMSSMLAAAVDGRQMDVISARLANRGLSVRTREEMHIGVAKVEPAAWTLVCRRE
ncbi:MAG TPA: class I SAM-dependent methyltransferase [Lysobacter sp.]|nr:class I SAM-dependent methyltransferase [Lysobacter sp.]